jgi:hypothetical protein
LAFKGSNRFIYFGVDLVVAGVRGNGFVA